MNKVRSAAYVIGSALLIAGIMFLGMVTAYASPEARNADVGAKDHVEARQSDAHTAWSCDKVNVTILPFHNDTILSKSISDLNLLTKMDVTLGLVITQRTWTVEDCNIEIGYINTSLYIARELSASQCAFDHVMEHEQEHLAIYRRHIATLKERAEQRLPQAKTLGELHTALNFLTLSPRPDHAQLDSPEEYAKNVHVCRGKIKQIMLNYINGR
jgi:hypothetical protein